jgi:23S rRNA (adenine2503-C2)-methyltransferase
MGMGEPLLNYENVVDAVKILRSKVGLNFSRSNITLSTVGIIPGLRRLGHDLDIKLAVSINAATENIRDRLMPVNRKYPLSDLMNALKNYPLKKRERITIEYVLIKGLNDSKKDAGNLNRILKGIRCKVNVIPLNETPEIDYERPSEEGVEKFREYLEDLGLTATIRKSKGIDIKGACGQLAGKY